MRSNFIRNTIFVVAGISQGYDFVAGMRKLHALPAARHLLARLKPSLNALATRLYSTLSDTSATAPTFGEYSPPQQERLQEIRQACGTWGLGAAWHGCLVPVSVGSCRVS